MTARPAKTATASVHRAGLRRRMAAARAVADVMVAAAESGSTVLRSSVSVHADGSCSVTVRVEP